MGPTTEEGYYADLYRKVCEEETGLSDLSAGQLEAYAEILLVAQKKQIMGLLGPDRRPDECGSILGLFLNEDAPIAKKLEAKGLTAARHEFLYVTCSLYWLRMNEIAGEMDEHERRRYCQ